LHAPNLHTPSIAKAIKAGIFMVPEEEILECLTFYWKVMVATWSFENAYTKACFEADQPAFTTFSPFTILPHISIRYESPWPLPDDSSRFYWFGPPLGDSNRYLENPYYSQPNFERGIKGRDNSRWTVAGAYPRS